MARFALIAASVIAMTALAACDSEDAGKDAPALGSYELLSMGGADVADAGVVVTLSEGQVSGQGFCNQFSGPQTAGLPALKIGPLAMTRKACLGDLMAQDQALADALTAADSASFADDRLTITGAGPDLVLAPQD